jgi:hypothetical protein
LQVWDFTGLIYELTLYCVEDTGASECRTHAARSKYYAVGTDTLMALMAQAGFRKVRRIDERFFQPLLVGSR